MTLKVRVPVQILLKRIPLGLGSLDPFERDRAGSQPLRLAFFVPVAFLRVLFSPCVRTLCVDFVDTRS